MSNELSIHHTTGKTVYFAVRSGGSFALAAGGGLEAYNADHWADYAIAAAEIGATSIYQASMSGGLSAGTYAIEVYEQSGGSPAVADPFLGPGAIAWSGTVEIQPFDPDASSVTVGGYASGQDPKTLVETAGGQLATLHDLRPDNKPTVDAGGKQAAKFDWTADVSSKPTIGTSMFDPASQTVKATDHNGAYVATYSGQVNLASGVSSVLVNVDGLGDEIAIVQERTNNLPNNPAAVGDVPTAAQVADAVLSRDVSNVEASAPLASLVTLVLATTNKANAADNPGYLTVYQTNGTTEHVRIPISIDVDAAPIEGIG